jgi:hypothetical protein
VAGFFKESGRFFEKKLRKKLSLLRSRDFHAPTAQIKKSLFASFSSEKEVLTSSPQAGKKSGTDKYRSPVS